MRYYSKSSCQTLLVCSAILCWNSNLSNYSFVNVTRCTPTPLDFKSNLQLIPINNQYLLSKKIINGFSCLNCTRKNFIQYQSNQQCLEEKTMIELRNYCNYKYSRINRCQCFLSNKTIQPITDWIKAIRKSGKSDRNILRVNNINQSSTSSVYILPACIIFLVIFGGIIGMMFYCVKLKQLQTLK